MEYVLQELEGVKKQILKASAENHEMAVKCGDLKVSWTKKKKELPGFLPSLLFQN